MARTICGKKENHRLMKANTFEETSLPEAFRMLIQRLRRGASLFHYLYLIFAGCAGGAIFASTISHGWLPWAVVAFIMSLVCRLTVLLHVGKRYISARKIAQAPQIVYWGHSINERGEFSDTAVTASNKIRLHLKDGADLSVEAVGGTGTSQAQLQEFILWLRQKNPSMRWGNYDQPAF
jgi:hypothetical protein